MKKSILAVLLVFTAIQYGKAQIPGGTVAVGVDLYFSNQQSTFGSGTNETENTYMEAGVTPGIGLFIANNLEIGASVGLDYEKNSNTHPYLLAEGGTRDMETWNKSTALFVSPYVTFYKMFGKTFGMFLKASGEVAFGRQTFKDIDYDAEWDMEGVPPLAETKYKNSSWGVFATPGLVIFPNEHWGFMAELGYVGFETGKSEWDLDDHQFRLSSSSLQAILDMSLLSIGVRYFFGK